MSQTIVLQKGFVTTLDSVEGLEGVYAGRQPMNKFGSTCTDTLFLYHKVGSLPFFELRFNIYRKGCGCVIDDGNNKVFVLPGTCGKKFWYQLLEFDDRILEIKPIPAPTQD